VWPLSHLPGSEVVLCCPSHCYPVPTQVHLQVLLSTPLNSRLLVCWSWFVRTQLCPLDSHGFFMIHLHLTTTPSFYLDLTSVSLLIIRTSTNLAWVTSNLCLSVVFCFQYLQFQISYSLVPVNICHLHVLLSSSVPHGTLSSSIGQPSNLLLPHVNHLQVLRSLCKEISW
jgi:hypothetical protein